MSSLNIPIIESFQPPIPRELRWFDVSNTPPCEDPFVPYEYVVCLETDDPNGETLYLRLETPAHIHSVVPGDEDAVPTTADVRINLESGEVEFADTEPARFTQEIIEAFPAPVSLKKVTHMANVPYDAARAFLAAMVAQDSGDDRDMPVVVMEGNPVERDRAMSHLTLWLCYIQELVRDGAGNPDTQ